MRSNSQIIDQMSATMRRLRSIVDKRAAAHGLTLARLRVLLRLSASEGLSQVELAQALQIEPPTLKRQIDALVRDGFIERQSIPGGGRAMALYLTDYARGHELTEFGRSTRHRLFEGVSPADLDTFEAVLRHINANIDRLERE